MSSLHPGDATGLIALDPQVEHGWNETLSSLPGGSIFHTSQWARVLTGTYGFQPLYIARTSGEHHSAIVPMMEVCSRLTGRRAVGLPFSDSCAPLGVSRDSTAGALALLADIGSRRKWKYIEFRGGCPEAAGVHPATWFYDHVLDIARTEAEILSGLRPNVRSRVRKAAPHGVVVTRGDSEEAMRGYYRLHCRTRRRHGLPPQPWRFFRNIHRYIMAEGMGTVVTALKGSEPISSLVCARFGGRAIYKFGATDTGKDDVHAAYHAMWEAIRWAREGGCREFGFGRTDADQPGLKRFKEGWGAKCQILNYYRYDLRAGAFVETNTPSRRSGFAVLQRCPVPALRLVGAFLYRHAG